MDENSLDIASRLCAEKSSALSDFYKEVKYIEKRDANLNSKDQIERLHRPGSSYFNLNPFDVLQVPPEYPLPEIKKKYRQISLLVHPDKNPEDSERSRKAFEIVSKAYKRLEDPKTYKECQDIVGEAKSRVENIMTEKRKANLRAKKGTFIDEDDPEKYRHAVYVQTCIIFADIERIRVRDETKQMSDRKRKADEEEDAKLTVELNKEWNKNFEESRNDRVHSWKKFHEVKAKKKKLVARGFKPPKPKMEQRN